MNNLRNRVQLIGHLGAAPEVKTVNDRSKVARLSIATNERYKMANGEWKEETQWHTVSLWEKLAEQAETQLHKGSYLLIEGKLVNRNYVGADGQKKYITEIRAHSFVPLDKPSSATNATLLQE